MARCKRLGRSMGYGGNDYMLKNIPKILSPQLLKVLCEMGHSDRLVIADGNFPAESIGKDANLMLQKGVVAD